MSTARPASTWATATARAPQVSIGVPVFNGERFLARTLASLLGQTPADLELIISDNASTDGTQAICEEFARRDGRVRYIRQPANIGAPRNWNVVAEEARGEYFKWSSASDICPPHAVQRCVDAMRADASVVLCYGRTQFVDEEERPIEGVAEADIDVGERLPSERFAKVCTEFKLNNAQCGVFRLDALKRTRLDRPYPSGDMALMEELALYGKFRLLPDVLLLRRRSQETFTSMLSPLERQRIYHPDAVRPMKLIRLRRHADSALSILRAPIPLTEKAHAYRFALKRAWWDRRELRRELQSLLGA